MIKLIISKRLIDDNEKFQPGCFDFFKIKDALKERDQLFMTVTRDDGVVMKDMEIVLSDIKVSHFVSMSHAILGTAQDMFRDNENKTDDLVILNHEVDLIILNQTLTDDLENAYSFRLQYNTFTDTFLFIINNDGATAVGSGIVINVQPKGDGVEGEEVSTDGYAQGYDPAYPVYKLGFSAAEFKDFIELLIQQFNINVSK